MKNNNNSFSDFISLSEKYGRDDQLIQGAGGNTSFKDSSHMLIKASGKWLSEAKNGDIFVDVDLSKIQGLIENNSKDPLHGAVLTNAGLKPSIETTLHAIMPHKIVVHTHPIDIIGIAIKNDAKSIFSTILHGIKWAWVDYAKPGVELTKLVRKAIISKKIDVLILGNHGLVVAGETCSEVDSLMQDIQLLCKLPARRFDYKKVNLPPVQLSFGTWARTEDNLINSLAMDPISNSFFQKGILYPDQAVFLGSEPCFVGLEENPENIVQSYADKNSVYPSYYIHRDVGVYLSERASRNIAVMLKCHAEVLSRIGGDEILNVLSACQVSELVNWDAEKYRQAMESH
ncbi:class II aldolase/adducin family protein [Planktomarina sp.]|nr:class II aldolase/adducin family protein [Planktomarina sp.]